MTQEDHDLLTRIDERLKIIGKWTGTIEKKIDNHIKEHTQKSQWSIGQIIIITGCLITNGFTLIYFLLK